MEYMPYYGPTVAASTPAGQTAMQGYADAAGAFGLAPKGMDVMAGMPKPTDFGPLGMAYSSGDVYDLARQELAARHPQLAAARESLFRTTYGDSPRYAQTDPSGYGPGGGGGPRGGGYGGYGGYGYFPNVPGGMPPYGTDAFYDYVRQVTGTEV